MGDVSAEPSMEDILSSIKRIIAEDGDGGQPQRVRRAPRVATTASVPRDDDAEREPEVLELSNLAPGADADDEFESEPAIEPANGSVQPDQIVSQDALASSRGSLNALTRMIAKPEVEPAAATGDGKSMDAFVAELLRPLLREWLDANLPELVEAMVAKEIARITGSR